MNKEFTQEEQGHKNMTLKENQMFEFFLKNGGRDVVDASMGAFIYIVYGYVYKKQSVQKALASFAVGVISAMYVAPQAADIMQWANRNLIVFVCGMLGMRLVDAVLSAEFKALVQAWVDMLKPRKK